MNSEFNIRKAEIGDIPKILDLLLQVDMVHHNARPDLFKGPATKYNEKQLKDIIIDEKSPVFVCADKNNAVCGYAFCKIQQYIGDSIMTDIKTLYIDDLCVDENMRGKHIGQTLYNYVADFAKSIGCYNVTLNVWSQNTGAVKFYKKCGMSPQKVGMEQIL